MRLTFKGGARCVGGWSVTRIEVRWEDFTTTKEGGIRDRSEVLARRLFRFVSEVMETQFESRKFQRRGNSIVNE